MSFYESRESLLFARSFQKIHSPRNGMGARLKTRDKITRSRLVSFGHSGNWRVREPIERGLQEKRSVRIVTVNRPRFNYIVFSLSLSQPNFVHPWKRGARARARRLIEFLPTLSTFRPVANRLRQELIPRQRSGFLTPAGISCSSRHGGGVSYRKRKRTVLPREIFSLPRIYTKKKIYAIN